MRDNVRKSVMTFTCHNYCTKPGYKINGYKQLTETSNKSSNLENGKKEMVLVASY